MSCLDALGRANDFDWILSANRLMIVRRDAEGRSARRDTPPHIVSAATGMIGSPQILIQQVEVKKLLTPKIVPGDRVDIQAETRNFASSGVYTADMMQIDPTGGNGIYVALSVQHTGDFSGDTWETSIGGVREVP